jgi:hypothetical protein
MGALYVALMHGGVVDKTGSEIASSLTHFDVHDIARSCRTYGIARYYVVTPLETMRYLAQRMISYWQAGIGNFSIPNRGEALEVVEVAIDLEEVLTSIEKKENKRPLIVATSARAQSVQVDYPVLARRIREAPEPVLILFGTAYGLSRRILDQCDHTLPPIRAGRWNHLSVRSAVAITLERLVGEGN